MAFLRSDTHLEVRHDTRREARHVQHAKSITAIVSDTGALLPEHRPRCAAPTRVRRAASTAAVTTQYTLPVTGEHSGHV